MTSEAQHETNDITGEPTLLINETFFSIQGESTWAGLKTFFIRLTGCHLRCTYCDTKYSYFEGKRRSLHSLETELSQYPAETVCITGGEPLLQKNVHPLMRRLVQGGYPVSLETSGDLSVRDVAPEVKCVIDIKTPDSGEGGRFHADNLHDIRPGTEFKFVICSEKDFRWASDFVEQHRLHESAPVLFSPSFDQVSPRALAEWILQSSLPIRLQLQLHKYIWSPSQRGI